MDAETILDILGNRTRRDIIKLVSQDPRYITELKKETRVEKMALSRHLLMMKDANLLRSETEQGAKGRPRKYYDIPCRMKITVNISPNNFKVKVAEPEMPEPDGIHDIRVQGAAGITDPVKKLVALSEVADDIQREIRLHEEAIHRLEGTLSRIREIGRELTEEMEMDEVDGRIMVEIMLSEKGSGVEDISTEVRKSSDTVRTHLAHLENRDLVECKDSKWIIR